MMEQYENMILEVVLFEKLDVITASCPDYTASNTPGQIETPEE